MFCGGHCPERTGTRPAPDSAVRSSTFSRAASRSVTGLHVGEAHIAATGALVAGLSTVGGHQSDGSLWFPGVPPVTNPQHAHAGVIAGGSCRSSQMEHSVAGRGGAGRGRLARLGDRRARGPSSPGPTLLSWRHDRAGRGPGTLNQLAMSMPHVTVEHGPRATPPGRHTDSAGSMWVVLWGKSKRWMKWRCLRKIGGLPLQPDRHALPEGP